MSSDKRENKEPSNAEKQIFLQLKEQLAAGKITRENISDAYLEYHRIVDPKSKEGLAFHEQMDKVLKLLVPEPEFSKTVAKHPILFLLSDMKEPNGYVIPTENQTIICLDKELFNKCENFNQLAYVVLHELTHLKIYDVFGEGKNSQLEEGMCDTRPLRKMSELGLNMNEAKNIMRNLHSECIPSWMALVDAHPLPQYRLDVIESSLGIMKGLMGDAAAPEKKEIRPMPQNLMDAVNAGVHHSYIDLQCKALQFESLTPEKQIDTFESWIPSLTSQYPTRLLDAQKALDKVRLDETNVQHVTSITNIFNKLLQYPEIYNQIRYTLQNKLPKTDGKTRPEGVIKGLAVAMEGFINARSYGDMKSYAQQIMAIHGKQPTHKLDLTNLDLPHYQLESKKEYAKILKEADGMDVDLPWHHQIRLLTKSPNSDILRSLWLMGVLDPRLMPIATEDDCKWFKANIENPLLTFELNTLSVPKDTKNTMLLDNLAVDELGSIRGFSKFSYRNTYLSKINQKLFDLGHEQVKQEGLFNQQEDFKIDHITRDDFVNNHEELLSKWEGFLLIKFDHSVSQSQGRFKISQKQKTEIADSEREELSDEFNRTRGNINKLVAKFDEWLSDETFKDRPELINIIKSFFLEKKLPINFLVSDEFHSGIEAESLFNDLNRRHNNVIGKPYLEFIAEDKYGLFTLAEKSELFNKAHTTTGIRLFRKAFNYKEPKTFEELKAVLNLYNNMEFIIADKYLLKDHVESNTLDAAVSEVTHFIKNHKKQCNYAELMVLFPQIMTNACTEKDHRQTYESNGSMPKWPDKFFKSYIRNDLVLPTNPLEFAPIYFCISDSNSFPSEKWRKDFVDAASKAIRGITDADQRIKAAEGFLLSKNEIKDTDLRSNMIDLWIHACEQKYQQDNNTKNYRERIEPLIKRVEEKAVSSIRKEMLHGLCDVVVSQRDLSHRCEKAVYGTMDREKMGSMDGVLGISQAGLSSILRSNIKRRELLQFLTKPLNRNTILDYADENRELLYDDGIEISPFERQQLYITSKRMHENFWSAPMAVRTFVTKTLLIPSEDQLFSEREKETNFQAAVQFAMNELLPLETADKKIIPFAKESRELLKAFLAKGVLDENQRPIFVSALMSAVRQGEEKGNDIRIGQRLATLLDMMGPAWKKLGQAISSHPDTPREIAADMEPLKGKIDMPRWQMWALYENTVPQELRESYPVLGSILGSASFFTTVDAGDSVFALQTPYARERASDGFATMERLIEELKSGNYAIGNAVPDSMADMVKSARISAALETNGKVGAAQAQALAKRYNGTKVNINRQDIEFASAQWLNYGQEFRHMEKMPGMVFNDFAKKAENNPGLQKQVQNISKGVAALEIMHRLDGGVSDDDRHGRNFVVSGNKVGMFDVGATHAIIRDSKGKVIEPTDADRVDEVLNNGGTVEVYEPGNKKYASNGDMPMLGDALVESLKALQQNKPLAVAMHEQIEKKRSEGKNPEILIRTERGTLALQDCLKHQNSQGQDITDIMAGIYNGGGKDSFVHPDIRRVLEDRIASGEFGDVSKSAKLALATAKLMGGNKGQIMLNHYFKQHAQQPVVISPGRKTEAPEPQFWDVAKNTKEISTLCTEEDIAKKSPPKETKKAKSGKRNHVPSGSYTMLAVRDNASMQI